MDVGESTPTPTYVLFELLCVQIAQPSGRATSSAIGPPADEVVRQGDREGKPARHVLRPARQCVAQPPNRPPDQPDGERPTQPMPHQTRQGARQMAWLGSSWEADKTPTQRQTARHPVFRFGV